MYIEFIFCTKYSLGLYNPSMNTEPFQKFVPKPWGREIIFTDPSLPYFGKIMQVKAGTRWSLHYHEEKLETLALLSGEAEIWLEDASGEIQKIPMELEKGYNISLKQKHRVVTKTDCIIVEASLPETGTTVRIEDDFSRGNETEELRKLDNRGWTPTT